VFPRIFSVLVLVAVGWLCVRQWEEGWSLDDAPDARFPGLVDSADGLLPAPGADPWRLANNHHLVARVLVHEDAPLPLATRGVLATALLGPELSGLLSANLGLTPELAAVALTPALDRSLRQACPAVPGHLARRCDDRGWFDVRRRLPGVLAAALAGGGDRLAVEILGAVCEDPPLAGAVAGALRQTEVARGGAPRPAALAVFLDGCAAPDGASAVQALSAPPPVQWMAALELAGRSDAPAADDAATLTAALLRYSASISSSRTAVPSSP